MGQQLFLFLAVLIQKKSICKIEKLSHFLPRKDMPKRLEVGGGKSTIKEVLENTYSLDCLPEGMDSAIFTWLLGDY